MEALAAPIPLESQKLALEGKSENTTENIKRPAPSAGGCRIEGHVRVKRVSPIKWSWYFLYTLHVTVREMLFPESSFVASRALHSCNCSINNCCWQEHSQAITLVIQGLFLHSHNMLAISLTCKLCLKGILCFSLQC